MADVSDTHVAVLNKFNVVEGHLLVITRAFEHQDGLLEWSDFDALWRCLAEYPALGFYNGGVIAGASQVHKHLQVVPLPLSAEGPALPFDSLLGRATEVDRVETVPGLPFRHAFVRFGDGLRHEPPGRFAAKALAWYQELLSGVDRTPRQGEIGPRTDPYNLLCTREWMIVVPRGAGVLRRHLPQQPRLRRSISGEGSGPGGSTSPGRPVAGPDPRRRSSTLCRIERRLSSTRWGGALAARCFWP